MKFDGFIAYIIRGIILYLYLPQLAAQKLKIINFQSLSLLLCNFKLEIFSVLIMFPGA